MGCVFEVGEESPCTHIVHGGNLDAAGGVHPGGQRLLVGRAWFHAKKGGFRKGECECCCKPGEGGGWQRSGVFCSVGHRCCMATFNGGVCMWPRRTDRDVRSAPPPSNAQACVRSCAFPRVPSSFPTPSDIPSLLRNSWPKIEVGGSLTCRDVAGNLRQLHCPCSLLPPLQRLHRCIEHFSSSRFSAWIRPRCFQRRGTPIGRSSPIR